MCLEGEGVPFPGAIVFLAPGLIAWWSDLTWYDAWVIPELTGVLLAGKGELSVLVEV